MLTIIYDKHKPHLPTIDQREWSTREHSPENITPQLCINKHRSYLLPRENLKLPYIPNQAH